MRKRNIEIAGGLGELKGKIFRIGHMGEVTANDIIAMIAALERTLLKLGYEIKLGTGILAVQEKLQNNDF